MARREYSDETKAQVMAALLAGQAITAVAKEYQLPRSTVGLWRQQLAKRVHVDVEQKSPNDGPTLDDLLQRYVETNLVTLQKQSEFVRDPKWLSRQSASELAVLHGVLADKTVRILEAYGDAGHADGTGAARS